MMRFSKEPFYSNLAPLERSAHSFNHKILENGKSWSGLKGLYKSFLNSFETGEHINQDKFEELREVGVEDFRKRIGPKADGIPDYEVVNSFFLLSLEGKELNVFCYNRYKAFIFKNNELKAVEDSISIRSTDMLVILENTKDAIGFDLEKVKKENVSAFIVGFEKEVVEPRIPHTPSVVKPVSAEPTLPMIEKEVITENDLTSKVEAEELANEPAGPISAPVLASGTVPTPPKRKKRWFIYVLLFLGLAAVGSFVIRDKIYPYYNLAIREIKKRIEPPQTSFNEELSSVDKAMESYYSNPTFKGLEDAKRELDKDIKTGIISEEEGAVKEKEITSERVRLMNIRLTIIDQKIGELDVLMLSERLEDAKKLVDETYVQLDELFPTEELNNTQEVRQRRVKLENYDNMVTDFESDEVILGF